MSSIVPTDALASANPTPLDAPNLVLVPSSSTTADVIDSDMMARFEALSKAFKGEVQMMLGHEQETAREDMEKVKERNAALEMKQAAQNAEMRSMTAALRSFVSECQSAHLAHIFGVGETSELPTIGVCEFRAALDAFLEVNRSVVRPELEQAQKEKEDMESCLEARNVELEELRKELAVACALKSGEEKELIKFKMLREKESELQAALIKMQEIQSQLEELRSENKQLTARGLQYDAVQREKSEKIIELLKSLEQQSEYMRLLSDENSTMRVGLGQDLDYLKIALPASDPLSCTSATGTLSEQLKSEEAHFTIDLAEQIVKFPGLAAGDGNCRRWCDLQIGRLRDLYCNFLHKFQDHMKRFPKEMKVEFVSRTEEVGSDWAEQEDQMRKADIGFQDDDRKHTKKWEEQRVNLVLERDRKVKQLHEQAERSQSAAEKQLLLHQAKLFGDRINAQIERAWGEQRKEHNSRWSEHQQRKADVRQKFKDESLSVQRRADDTTSASSRFQDMASTRLAAIEDAWLRTCEKDTVVRHSVFKSDDLEICLQSVLRRPPELPSRGSERVGVDLVVDEVHELLTLRMKHRQSLHKDLEEQTLQQLRSCVDKFIQREAAQQKLGKPNCEEMVPECTQAVVITSLLQMRQHRHLRDTLKRQLYDFLLVLHVARLASVWLMPEKLMKPFLEVNKALDLPPLPAEFAPTEEDSKGEVDMETQLSLLSAENEDVLDDCAVEGKFSYESLCQHLLERTLKSMNTAQREELLIFKQKCTTEQRLALQSLCQLEGDQVAHAVQQDLREYELQVSTRLLADCEASVCEERKQLMVEVGNEVADLTAKCRHDIEEEEQAVLKERRKWLTDRSAVLQASGSSLPGEKTLLQRMRQELRVCEDKIELYNKEFGQREAVSPQHGAPKRSHTPPTVRKLPVRSLVGTVEHRHSQQQPRGFQTQGKGQQQQQDLVLQQCQSTDPNKSTTCAPSASSNTSNITALLPRDQALAPNKSYMHLARFGLKGQSSESRLSSPPYEGHLEPAVCATHRSVLPPPNVSGGRSPQGPRSLSVPSAACLKPLDVLTAPRLTPLEPEFPALPRSAPEVRAKLHGGEEKLRLGASFSVESCGLKSTARRIPPLLPRVQARHC